jgi:hypothetical protein
MLAMGWNLERVSLGSLIIALGLLVDDGIIAVEMMVVKMESGWDRVKAAAFSYASTAMPRLTGALITTAAFTGVLGLVMRAVPRSANTQSLAFFTVRRHQLARCLFMTSLVYVFRVLIQP